MKKFFKANTDWINDEHGFLPLWKVLGLYLFFAGFSMIWAKVGLQVTSWLNPQFPKDSPAFFDFLDTEPVSNLLVTLVGLAILFGVFYLAKARFFGPEKEKRPYLKWILIGLLIEFFIQLGDYMINHYGPQLGVSANQAIHNETIMKADFWRLVISMGLIPAIEEELVVRGLIQRFAFAKWPIVGIIVQAIIFGSMHYTTNPYHAALYMLSGGLFGYLYYKSGRLEVPMIVHFIGNVCVIAYFKFLT